MHGTYIIFQSRSPFRYCFPPINPLSFHSNIPLRSLPPNPRNLIHLSWTSENSSFLGESMREENFYGSLDSYSLPRRTWRKKGIAVRSSCFHQKIRQVGLTWWLVNRPRIENFTFVSNSFRNFEMEIMKCPLANKLLKKLGTLVRFHDGIIAP